MTDQPSANSAVKQALDQQDKSFVKQAALGGIAEVQLSKIAQKSANPDVKSVADRMVLDHTGANGQLTTIAAEEHQKMALDVSHHLSQTASK